jgi:hypothetical protein
MKMFKNSNMVIAFLNIIFFIIVQTLFFKYFASKQFNTVLENKIDILNTYSELDPQAKEIIDAHLNSPQAAFIKEIAEYQELEREELNNKLIKKWIGIPLTLSIILLIILFSLLLREDSVNRWNGSDTAVLSLIVGAYATELMFYFGIVRQYEFYGDMQLVNKLYSNVYDKYFNR